MTKVLIVEDESAIADVIEFAVTRAGLEAERAESLSAARSALKLHSIDLVVLDLGLPDGDGLDLCLELRRSSAIPVLMLTCRDEEVDRIVGLETGADDYVVKPFSPRELVARIRAILRRCQGGLGDERLETIRYGRVSIVPDELRVCLDDIPIRLTPTELALLEVLLRSPRRVHSRSALIDRVYQPTCFISDRTIDSHIKGIRRRFTSIDPAADPIETVVGVGYRARVVE